MPMITLYQFAPAFGLPNASPFCMKLETYLRMAQLPHQVSKPKMQDLQKAPKGKLPFIEDDGQLMGDSSFIVEHLKAKYGDALDAHLSPQERATALAFQRLMEENLYWALLHSRWIVPEGWVVTREAFFGKMSAPFKWLIPPLARRGMRSQLRGQGMGRHSTAEIYSIGKRDITALSQFLADKPFFMGDVPSSIDATVFAFMANLVLAPLDSELIQHARQHPNLQAYCQRMKAKYFPELS